MEKGGDVHGAGRPLKPYALRKLEGDTTKKSKAFNERYEHEICVDGEFPVGSPPDWLTEEAVEEWNRLAGPMAMAGLLKVTDYQAFANYCQAAGEVGYLEKEIVKEHLYYVTDDKGRLLMHPGIKVLAQRKQELISLLKEFGFTPSMRAKLSVLNTMKKEEDEYSMGSLLDRRPG